jgi:hypothetical protein
MAPDEAVPKLQFLEQLLTRACFIEPKVRTNRVLEQAQIAMSPLTWILNQSILQLFQNFETALYFNLLKREVSNVLPFERVE